MRGDLIDRLGRILDDASARPREVTAAAKAILSASKINLENVSVAVNAIELLELRARVARIERTIDERGMGRAGYSRD